MFPEEHEKSLLPMPELAQNQVGIMAGGIDIVEDCSSADLAGIVDHYITKAEEALEN
jgi:hypothetical protein